MSSDSPKSPNSQRSLLTDEVREALAAARSEELPDEREFAARLHRRLAAAGPPPAPGWLERLSASVVDLWQGVAPKRSLVTGALLGALATAAAFLILQGRPWRDGPPAAAPDDETADVGSAIEGSVVAPVGRKAQRAVGDRRLTRDRLEQDIGAERPERSHVRPETSR
jgi:hypothetical protein